MSDTLIDYLDKSWNPIQDKEKGKSGNGYHCTKVSKGCTNCWAERMNKRIGNGKAFVERYSVLSIQKSEKSVNKSRERIKTEFEIKESELLKPFKWRKPCRIGVQFMGDLFHEDVPFDMIERVFKVTHQNPRHTFIIFTKRPEMMKEYFDGILKNWIAIPPHIWLCTSVEDQKTADERIPILLSIPAAVRGVSYEPALSPVDFSKFFKNNCKYCGKSLNKFDSCSNCEADYPYKVGIDWVIMGGEAGPGSRPMHPEWARSVQKQCAEAEVAFWSKQWGDYVMSNEQLVMNNKSKRVEHMNIKGEIFKKGINVNSDDIQQKWYETFKRVGKKKAGHLLDGRAYQEIPNNK